MHSLYQALLSHLIEPKSRWFLRLKGRRRIAILSVRYQKWTRDSFKCPWPPAIYAEQWLIFPKGALRKSARDFYKELESSDKQTGDGTNFFTIIKEVRAEISWSDAQMALLNPICASAWEAVQRK